MEGISNMYYLKMERYVTNHKIREGGTMEGISNMYYLKMES
jgi:hypothetical protein